MCGDGVRRLAPGASATISGLDRMAELNGRSCVLVKLHELKARWEVKLPGDGEHSKTLLLKACNIKPAADASTSHTVKVTPFQRRSMTGGAGRAGESCSEQTPGNPNNPSDGCEAPSNCTPQLATRDTQRRETAQEQAANLRWAAEQEQWDRVSQVLVAADSAQLDHLISLGAPQAAALWLAMDSHARGAVSFNELKASLKSNEPAKQFLLQGSSWADLLAAVDPRGSGIVEQRSFESVYLGYWMADCAAAHCQPMESCSLRSSFIEMAHSAVLMLGALLEQRRKPHHHLDQLDQLDQQEQEAEPEHDEAEADLSHRNVKRFLQLNKPIRRLLFGSHDDSCKAGYDHWGKLFWLLGSLDSKPVDSTRLLALLLCSPLRSASARRRDDQECAHELEAASCKLQQQLAEAVAVKAERKKVAAAARRVAEAEAAERKQRMEAQARRSKKAATEAIELQRALHRLAAAAQGLWSGAVSEEPRDDAEDVSKMTPLQRRNFRNTQRAAAKQAAPSKRKQKAERSTAANEDSAAEDSATDRLNMVANLAYFERYDLATGFPNLAAAKGFQRQAAAPSERSKSVGRPQRQANTPLDAWDLYLHQLAADRRARHTAEQLAKQEPPAPTRSYRQPRGGVPRVDAAVVTGSGGRSQRFKSPGVTHC